MAARAAVQLGEVLSIKNQRNQEHKYSKFIDLKWLQQNLIQKLIGEELNIVEEVCILDHIGQIGKEMLHILSDILTALQIWSWHANCPPLQKAY